MFPKENASGLQPNNGLMRRLLYPDWADYVSLCRHAELFSYILDNPLLVVHPGFRKWWPGEMLRTQDFDRLDYEGYLGNLRFKVEETLLERRTMFVFTPVQYRQEALAIIGQPQDAILVPTDYKGGMVLDGTLLGRRSRYFFEALSENISRAEICGEYEDRCVKTLESQLPQVEMTRVAGCVFPPPT